MGTTLSLSQSAARSRLVSGLVALSLSAVSLPRARAEAPPPASADAANTEPAKAEPAKAEPVSTEPAKAEPASTEPAKAEPVSTEPAKAEPASTAPASTEPANTEPAKPVTPASGESGSGAPSATGEAADPASKPAPETPPVGPTAAADDSLDLLNPSRGGRVALSITGGLLLAAGAASLTLMGLQLQRSAAREREGAELVGDTPTLVSASELQATQDAGAQANTLALVTGVAGGLLIGTGATMLVLGLSGLRKRDARHAFAPAVSRRAAGLTWRMRF